MSTTAESLLLMVDPLRGLYRARNDIDRLAELDPKIKEARRQLTDRLAAVTSSEGRDELLVPILWLHVCDVVKIPGNLNAFRQWLGNGEAVLVSVENALATTFTKHVIEEVMTEAGRQVKDDSVMAERLRVAREDMGRIGLIALDPNPPSKADIAYAAATLYIWIAAIYVALGGVLPLKRGDPWR